jgi:hypothetical protein
MAREDPIVYPTPPPALSWISGQDPLLVVSIVTTRVNPNSRIAFFLRHCDVMHPHAYLTLHAFVKTQILFEIIFISILARMVFIINSLLLFLCYTKTETITFANLGILLN